MADSPVTLKCATATTAHGWKLDTDAIRQALEFLGVSHPVTVKLSQGRRVSGSTSFQASVGYIVKVSRYLNDPAAASSTLWHELTHVLQAETAGSFSEFVKAYKRFSGTHGGSARYFANPYETEARRTAEAYCGDFPLARVAV